MLGRMPAHPRPRLWSATRGLALAAATMVLAGCGGSAGIAPPTGVDELQIPTASPEPRDFVATIDNPWLPLRPGSRWTYDIASGAPSPRPVSAVVEVLAEPAVVAGVTTTQVLSVVTDDRGATLRRELASYAQDARGNVWLFGRRVESPTGVVSWRAGEGGAQAGLAMAAHPRVGDGYEVAAAPGIDEQHAHVITLAATQLVGNESHDDLLVIDTGSSLDGSTGRQWFADGTGLLLADLSTGSVTEQWTLTAHRPG